MSLQPEPIPDTWSGLIAQFIIAQRASGISATTIRSRRDHLAQLARALTTPPAEITTSDLLDWTGRQSWAAETRRSRRQTYVVFWRYLETQQIALAIVAEALPRIKPAVGRPRPAPDTSWKAAKLAASPREQLMIELAAEHGLRRGEVATVHTDDLVEDLIGWSLIVHGKGNRERTVPLLRTTARKLLEIAKHNPGYVFPGADHGHLSPRWIGKLIARLLPRDLTMHQLRHRFATSAYAGSHDLLTVQELLGHSNPATTRRYCAIRSESLRRAVTAAHEAIA